MRGQAPFDPMQSGMHVFFLSGGQEAMVSLLGAPSETALWFTC